MRFARIVLLGAVLVLGRDGPVTAAEPSPWDGLRTGTHKFLATTDRNTKRFFATTSAGTKRFFRGTASALGLSKSDSSSTSSGTHSTWSRPVQTPQYVDSKQSKPSWFGSLFRRDESRPSKSLRDFLDAERPD